MKTNSLKCYYIAITLFLLFLLPIKAAAVTKSAYASCYSYTVSCNGATDIKITTDKYARISIFKKGMFTYQLLKSCSSVKSISCTSKLSGRNTYYMIISSCIKKPARIYISVNQHQDVKHSCNGGVWKVKRDSPVEYPYIVYLKKFFLTRSHCQQALAYVGKAKFLDYQSKLLQGTLTLGGLIMGNSGIKALNVASAFLSIAELGYSIDFKRNMISRIKNCGGYNSRTGKFARGIVLTEYFSGGFSHFSVDGWFPGKMTGPKGYLGSWSAR